MIYTVTFNPSLDYIVHVDHFAAGATNRTVYENILAGGKGINVSIVLGNLGTESTAFGFTAGFTGEQLKTLLKAQHVHTEFIPVKNGFTRINVKMKSDEETEINGSGPVIEEAEAEVLFERLKQLKKGDMLVISGSVPKSMGSDVYERILAMLEGSGVETVVDASGSLLRKVLPYHPYLIKPNHGELGELFGVDLHTREDVIPYAVKLQEEGARNVLVSLAGEGAVLVAETGEVFLGKAPKGTVVNSVGAGDSMVAGFLSGMQETGSYLEAFQRGIAAGSASAFTEHLAGKEAVEALLGQCEITRK